MGKSTVIQALLLLRQAFENGTIGTEEVSIKNISREEHIQLYRSMLGIRCYEPNKKHRRKPYIDAEDVMWMLWI